MNKACVFFKISDLVMHYPRNYKKYPDVTRVKNFVYDEKFGNFTRADLLYLTNQTSKRPIVVNVHGGGFVKGDKRHRRAICSEYARLGYFVYNVNYRTAPDYPLPNGCYDVVNAINKLPSLADEYSLDLNKIVFTGDSAGAFYAASAVLACVSEEYRKLLGVAEPLVKPTAFMGFCGAYRLGDILKRKTPLNIAASIADALMGEKCDIKVVDKHPNFVYTDLIPYVNETFPKSLLVYSTHDDFCGGQGELMREKLISSGVSVETFVATGEKDIHCFHLLPKHKTTPACMEKVRDYLKKI